VSLLARPWFAYVGSRTTRERNARGEGISVFRVDAHTGALARVQRVERLFALNEDSDSIVALTVDAQTGRLTPLQPPVACGSPVCMVFSAD
jgi:6-phosphogluconolactonase (cycloisomerase 2 family)